MKRFNEQICLKLAGPLRTELEDWAAEESRGLSSMIRKLLVDCVTQRITARAAAQQVNEERPHAA
jgi:hypothetical protein